MAELDIKQLFRDQAKSLLERLHIKSRDADLSMDLVQDAFVRLLERDQSQGDEREPMQNQAAYLNRVANNLLVDHFRSKAAQQTDVVANDELSDMAESGIHTDDQVAQQQQLQKMRDAVMQLPLRTRQVFQLCRLQDKSYAEAAQHLDISVSSVQKHLTQAMNYLSEALARDEK